MATVTGPAQSLIERKLQANLKGLVHLDLRNVSSLHNVPPGSETHFDAVIVADCFEGMKLIDRHRLVNGILVEELSDDGPVHAFSMTVRTPEQWEANRSVNKTPACLGGDGRAAGMSRQ